MTTSLGQICAPFPTTISQGGLTTWWGWGPGGGGWKCWCLVSGYQQCFEGLGWHRNRFGANVFLSLFLSLGRNMDSLGPLVREHWTWGNQPTLEDCCQTAMQAANSNFESVTSFCILGSSLGPTGPAFFQIQWVQCSHHIIMYDLYTPLWDKNFHDVYFIYVWMSWQRGAKSQGIGQG